VRTPTMTPTMVLFHFQIALFVTAVALLAHSFLVP
jgi:hypothetical protein